MATMFAVSKLAGLVVLLLGVFVVEAEVDHGELLLKWLESQEGSFWNSKLEIRRQEAQDLSSSYGIFVKEAIDIHEDLFTIPSDSILVTGEPRVGDRVVVEWNDDESYEAQITRVNKDGTFHVQFDDGDEDDIERDDFEFSSFPVNCAMVKRLVAHTRSKNSAFKPYINYLRDQPWSQVPAVWSKTGKGLLSEVVGELPPNLSSDWMEDWHDRCHGGANTLEEKAYVLVAQHGWQDRLVPIFDLVSHRNGKWTNTYKEIEMGAFTLRALRKIEPGEELFTSYNQCNDCDTRQGSYGTPEIFRDYGFIEEYPQRWMFPSHSVAFDLDEVAAEEDGTTQLQITWLPRIHKNSARGIIFMKTELQRLRDVYETDLAMLDPEVPRKEFDVTLKYHRAAVTALEAALKASDNGKDTTCPPGEVTCAALRNRYQSLEEEEETWSDERPLTCDPAGTFRLEEWEDVEAIPSNYQKIQFSENPFMGGGDMCFDLDSTVQICTSYRPQYHEMAVHYSARFLKSVKHCLFVGGGDSMLLDAILKYPSLEKVVGLELDQQVTRSSFKYFATQPHFHNEKVEWWFGDATKSLLMLPKEYFGSFDLVLVDLSETVMALSVTDELDVMEALALLLKPEGIIVKNEYMYFLDQARLFENTLHIHYYDVPVVCSQSLILSSDRTDFMRSDYNDHGVETLYTLLNEDQYGVMHDYQKNRTCLKHCREEGDSDKQLPTEQSKSPGILMIVEAEKASIDLTDVDAVYQAIRTAMESVEMSVLSSAISSVPMNETVLVFFLEQGYVVARAWAKHKYCGFDIHLWSKFEKHENLKKALVESVGSKLDGSTTSFRIVAGGMFGVDGWKQDESARGPRLMECTKSSSKARDAPVEKGTVNAVTKHFLELMMREEKDDPLVLVLCGAKGDSCDSASLLESLPDVAKVLQVWTCPGIDSNAGESGAKSERMFECEKKMRESIVEALPSTSGFSAVVLDASATREIAQIFLKIFSSDRNVGRWLSSDILYLAPLSDPSETWRSVFLDNLRTEVYVVEPLFVVEMLVNTTTSSLGYGLFSSGDQDFVMRLEESVQDLEFGSDFEVEIQKLRGGELEYIENREPAEVFSYEDFNLLSPTEQWESQTPLGRQSVIQFECRKGGSRSKDDFEDALKESLAKILDVEVTELEWHSKEGPGEGSVVSAIWSGGLVVLLWDGREHFDMSIFQYEDDVPFINSVGEELTSQLKGCSGSLRDDFPRGFGTVVNFKHDIEPRRPPYWKRPKVNQAGDDMNDEDSDEEEEDSAVHTRQTVHSVSDEL